MASLQYSLVMIVLIVVAETDTVGIDLLVFSHSVLNCNSVRWKLDSSLFCR